jgi:branched-chain amino acid transport system permease protein
MIGQAIVYGIIVGVLYGLAAVGLSLLFGVMRYMNIAHGSFIVIGGYLSFWLFKLWHIDPFISIPLVMATMFLLGLVVYKLLFSPLGRFPEKQRLGNSMLITFGLVLVLDNGMSLLSSSDVKTITTSYSGQVFEVLGIRLPFISVAVTGVALVVILGLHLFLNRTYFGKSIRATVQDWEGAILLGVNIDRAFLVACGISIALAGAAGTAIALMYSISPYSGLEWLLITSVVLVFAGLGNIKEVFFAGVVLGIIEQMSGFFIGGQYRAVVALVIFVLILLVRPQGLFRR